jgi:hypothetical protein
MKIDMIKACKMMHILTDTDESEKSIHDRFLEEFDIREALEIIRDSVKAITDYQLKTSPDSETPEIFAGTMDELDELKIRE